VTTLFSDIQFSLCNDCVAANIFHTSVIVYNSG